MIVNFSSSWWASVIFWTKCLCAYYVPLCLCDSCMKAIPHSYENWKSWTKNKKVDTIFIIRFLVFYRQLDYCYSHRSVLNEQSVEISSHITYTQEDWFSNLQLWTLLSIPYIGAMDYSSIIALYVHLKIGPSTYAFSDTWVLSVFSIFRSIVRLDKSWEWPWDRSLRSRILSPSRNRIARGLLRFYLIFSHMKGQGIILELHSYCL